MATKYRVRPGFVLHPINGGEPIEGGEVGVEVELTDEEAALYAVQVELNDPKAVAAAEKAEADAAKAAADAAAAAEKAAAGAGN